MAIQPTPPEPDLRAPRRRRRELHSLLWLCGWGGLTAVALTALAIASQGTESDAIHPGYGFLSERAALARLCETEGVVFIGPTAAQIEAVGDKLRARSGFSTRASNARSILSRAFVAFFRRCSPGNSTTP